MAEPIIAIQDLTHSFGRGMLRKPVPSEVSRGDFDGAFGVWQTTLLTLIGGLRSLQEGSLRVLGHSGLSHSSDGGWTIAGDTVSE
jgi:putative ABC transport system ATP-binding protein